MINVLYLIDNLVLAGAQKQLLQTLKYIDSTKYKKYVIYFDDCNGQIKEFSKYTDEILYIKRRFRWDISIIWKLLKFIHKEKITIVHSHLFMSTFFGVIASKIAGVPIVNQYIHNVTEPAKYRYVIMKLLFPLSDAILCSSRAGRDFFFSKINSKITVINNMISLDIGLLNQKTNIIQTHKLEHYEHFIGKVANFNKWKDYYSFFLMARIILEKFPKTAFLVIGDGKLKSRYQKYVEEIGISQNVKFFGSLSNPFDIINIFDIGVLFSFDNLGEAQSMAVCEYMSLKKPVIASNVGGIRETISNRITGYLVKSGDYQKAACYAIELLTDKEYCSKMGLEGYKKIEELFDAKKVIKIIQLIYDETLNRKKRIPQ